VTGSQAYVFQRHVFIFSQNESKVKAIIRTCLKKLDMPVDRLCHGSFTKSTLGTMRGWGVRREHSDKSVGTLLSRMVRVYMSQMAVKECTIIGVVLTMT
jgi:hypothetical protein